MRTHILRFYLLFICLSEFVRITLVCEFKRKHALTVVRCQNNLVVRITLFIRSVPPYWLVVFFPETNLKQGDPTWIGCWWLGYVICSVIVTIFAISIFFFPKSLSKLSEDVPQENGTENPSNGTEHPADEPGLIAQLQGLDSHTFGSVYSSY